MSVKKGIRISQNRKFKQANTQNDGEDLIYASEMAGSCNYRNGCDSLGDAVLGQYHTKLDLQAAADGADHRARCQLAACGQV